MTKPLVRRIETASGQKKRIWDHPIHTAYNAMKARCYTVSCREFKYYGERGIYICDKWLNEKWDFVAWAYEAGWEPGKSLNRIDNNGPYAPWNCEWTSHKEQCNNRRNNITLTAFGITKNAKQWAEDSQCKVSYRRLMRRVHANWDHTEAITCPPLTVGERRSIR